MATPSQAQLALERDAVLAEIASKTVLYKSMIAKGQVNSAQELLATINADKKIVSQLDSDIKNYAQFSAERASQDAEIASTQNFEAKNSPTNQIVTSTTSTATTTGGNQTTVTTGAASLTPDAAAAAKQANLKAQAYSANPAGKFGANTIDRAVSSGAITPEEGAALKAGAIPESERFATASAARQSGLDSVASGTVSVPPTTTITPTPNTADNTIVNQQLVSKPESVASTSNPNNRNTTTVTNLDGTVSEVSVDNTSATLTTTPIANNQLVQSTETTIVASQNIENLDPAEIDSGAGTDAEEQTFEPLQEPPGVTRDEFDGIDQQIEDNENSLQEPPLLSDEEVDAYLQQGLDSETITSPDSITENVFDPRQDVTENVFDPTQEVQESVFDPSAGGSGGYVGTTAQLNTKSQATQQDVANFKQKEDWRVRLSLAPNATYLYKDSSPGILAPLAATDGVIFPYTPVINVSYTAGYDPTEITHSNYKIFQYKNSSVDNVSITCEFTAQDTFEANYLLAVIHFFRSVTKMFYGQDQNPKPGTPPPLCYLSGLGAFQFDAHPLAVTNFTYSLPNDVDYIRAGSTTSGAGVPKSGSENKVNTGSSSSSRMASSGINPGGLASPPKFSGSAGTTEPTYVPTKMQITITAIPIVTRNDISNKFSLKEYGTGKLLQGTKRSGGGIW